jgi:hypothetical protein
MGRRVAPGWEEWAAPAPAPLPPTHLQYQSVHSSSVIRIALKRVKRRLVRKRTRTQVRRSGIHTSHHLPAHSRVCVERHSMSGGVGRAKVGSSWTSVRGCDAWCVDRCVVRSSYVRLGRRGIRYTPQEWRGKRDGHLLSSRTEDSHAAVLGGRTHRQGEKRSTAQPARTAGGIEHHASRRCGRTLSARGRPGERRVGSDTCLNDYG